MELNHLGLTVSDLEVSSAFYRDIVGMEIVRRGSGKRGGAFFDTLTRGHGGLIDVVILRGKGLVLQLVQYYEGGAEAAATGHNRAGCIHFCVDVDDIEQKYGVIVATGKYDPTTIVDHPNSEVRSFYISDPDGIPVEFLAGPFRADAGYGE